MDQNFDAQIFDSDDFFSGYPSFFIPSRVTWSDFLDFIDDELKGDLSES